MIMSRPLKFKFWCNEHKFVDSGFNTPIEEVFFNQRGELGRPCPLCLKSRPMTIVEFTGHQSIDDVDVHEGDVLKFPGTDDQFYLVKWLEETGQWGIMFGAKVFNLQMGTIGLAQFMQIAGNIYENKELVNGK
jgi:hypothetical protein